MPPGGREEPLGRVVLTVSVTPPVLAVGVAEWSASWSPRVTLVVPEALAEVGVGVMATLAAEPAVLVTPKFTWWWRR